MRFSLQGRFRGTPAVGRGSAPAVLGAWRASKGQGCRLPCPHCGLRWVKVGSFPKHKSAVNDLERKLFGTVDMSREKIGKVSGCDMIHRFKQVII